MENQAILEQQSVDFFSQQRIAFISALTETQNNHDAAELRRSLLLPAQQLENQTSQRLPQITKIFSQSFSVLKNVQSCFNAHYDASTFTIASKMVKKDRCTSLSPRGRWSISLGPGPSDYYSPSPLELSVKKRKGIVFPSSERSKQNKRSIPGPGAYSPNVVTENKAAYSMRIRPKSRTPEQYVGPSDYHVQKYGSIAVSSSPNTFFKYFRAPTARFNQQQRFISPKKSSIIPGPNRYNTLTPEQVHAPTFGRAKKGGIFGDRNGIPGPGAYDQFSEFAGRRRNLEYKLNKMEKLVKQN